MHRDRSARRARSDPLAIRAPHVELTPLIDVTFQVLIFLLVANDLSAKVQEDVELPHAENVTEVRPQDGVVTVNVLAPRQPEDPPRLRVGGHVFDVPGLTRALGHVANLHRPALDPDADTRAGVLIRADRGAPWRHVQRVLQACADRGVRIRRVQLATDPERLAAPREGGARR